MALKWWGYIFDERLPNGCRLFPAMTKYLGVLKTEIDYIQQLIDEAL